MKTDSTNAILHQYYYSIDVAGNRISEQVDANVTKATPNNLNQLTSLTAGGTSSKLHFVHSLCHSLERTIRYTLGFDNVALRAFDKADDGLPIFSCHTKMIQRCVNVGDERRSY